MEFRLNLKITDEKLHHHAVLIILTMYVGFALYPAPVWVWYRAGVPIVFVLLIAIGWTKLMDENIYGISLTSFYFTGLVLVNINPVILISQFIRH